MTPAVLDIHVGVSDQLFNSIDPAPFRDRDLDPAVVDYVVEWAEELPGDAALAIAVQIDRGGVDDTALIQAAFKENFRLLAATKRRYVSRMFRDGRISLVIGLTFVALAVGITEAVAMLATQSRTAQVIADSAVIGAWVALWHPINIFLFDWWPLRRRAVLYDRLSAADVRVTQPV